MTAQDGNNKETGAKAAKPKKARSPKFGKKLEIVKDAITAVTAKDGGKKAGRVSVEALEQLMDESRESGFVTYDQINDVLPSGAFSEEQLTDVMSLFDSRSAQPTGCW